MCAQNFTQKKTLIVACFFAISLFKPEINQAASCNWIGGTSNWNNPANWSCGVVPGAGDDVTIASGTVTVDVVATIQTLTLSGSADIVLNANMSISGNTTLSGTGSSISGTGNLDIGGNLSWTGTVISGSGAFTLAGTFAGSGAITLNTRSLSLTSGGTINGVNLTMLGGATFTIPAMKTLTTTGGNTISGNLATSTAWINNGTIVVESFVLTLGATQFTNNGAINLTTGDLHISGGTGSVSTHMGAAISIGSGRELSITASAAHNFTNTSISGAGNFEITGGSVIVNINAGSTVSTSVSNLGGTTSELVINSAQTVPSMIVSGGGKVTLNANLTNTGNLTMSGNSTTITGAGNLSIGGNLTWSDGTISGSGTLSLTGLLIGSGSFELNTRHLSLTSGGTLTNCTFGLLGGAALTIPATKTLSMAATSVSGCTINGNAGSGTAFVNNGTIETSGNVYDCTISNNIITNTGAVNINSKRFYISGSTASSHSGANFTIAAGNELIVNSTGAHTFTNTSVSGAGVFWVNSGNVNAVDFNAGTTISSELIITGRIVNLNTAMTVPTLTVNNNAGFTLNSNLTVSGIMSLISGTTSPTATVTGPGNLTIGGDFIWQKGIISGAGSFSVTGTVAMSAGNCTFSRAAFTLTSGGSLTNIQLDLTNGAAMTIPVGKTFTITTGANVTRINGDTNSATFINNGTIDILGTSNMSIQGVAISNNGTINVTGANLVFSGLANSSATHNGAIITIASGKRLELSSVTHVFNNNTTISGAGEFKINNSGAAATFNTGSTLGASIITASFGNLTLNSAQTFPSLTIESATVTLNENLTVSGNVSITNISGTITGPGNLAIGGSLTWNNGTISGGGSFSLVGNFSASNGTITLSQRQLTLTEGGTATNMFFEFENASLIQIPASKTFTFNHTGSKTISGAGTITNYGTFVKSGAGAVSTSNDCVFNNYNAVTIMDGLWNFTSNAHFHMGSLTLSAGTEASFRGLGTTYNFTNTAISGPGIFSFGGSSGVVVNLESGTTVTCPVVAKIAGTLNINASQTIPTLTSAGNVEFAMNLNADLTITGDAVFYLNNTGITGPGNLTIGGNLEWNEGKIVGIGTFSLAGSLTVSGGYGSPTLGRNLSLTEGGSFTNVGISFENNAQLTVPVAKTLTFNLSSTIGISSTGTIANNGTLVKSGAGTLSCSNGLVFNNNNIVNVTAGILNFGSGSNANFNMGSLTLSAGTEASFGGTSSTHNFANTSVSGAGTFIFGGNSGGVVNWDPGTVVGCPVVAKAAGTLNVNASQTIPSFTSAGNVEFEMNLNADLTITGNAVFYLNNTGITGPGNLTIGGNLEWNEGKIVGNGTFSLAGTLTIVDGYGTPTLGRNLSLTSGGTFTNNNFAFESSAQLTIPTGKTLSITNSGTRSFSGSGSVQNSGILHKSGTGFLLFQTGVYFTGLNGSTTHVQQATLQFAEIISNQETAIIKGSGTYKINTSQNAAYGSFQPGNSPGTLTFTGNYACETGSSLDIEIENGTPVLVDKLVVSGTALLQGTLNVIETGGVPTGSWTILTATSITGSFSTMNLPDCYEIEINATSIVLKKGVSKIWDGSTNTWSTDASWLPFGVPCPNDDVTINSGICNLDVQPQMSSLTINGGELKKIGAATYSVDVPTTIAAPAFLNVFAGTLDMNNTIVNDGTIEGYGEIDILGATFIGGFGRWAPGNSAGKLKAKGNHTNDVVAIEIGENGGVVEVDILEATQNLEIGGLLEVGYLGGTVPPGIRTIMECFGGTNCRTGTFANITYPPECGGSGCTVIYEPTKVRLQNTIPLEYVGPITWNGGIGNFELATNWTPNEVPNANDDITIDAGTVTLTTPATVKSLNFSGGNILGNFSLVVNNSFNWSGGTLGISANNYVGPTTFSGSTTLSNGGLFLEEGGSFAFGASLTLADNANLTIPIGSTLTIDNPTAGEIAQTGGANSVNILGNFVKQGAGSFAINPPFSSSGTTNIQAGILTFNGIFNNLGGILKGIGSIDLTNGVVEKTGAIAPGESPGELSWVGNFINDPQSIFDFEIEENAGNINKDLLEITGDATLNGTLNIHFLNGTIPLGNYPILTTTGTATGTFDEVNFLPNCPAPLCSIAYSTTGASLVLSVALPVELTSFFAKKKGETVELNWKTATETNVARFEIERSVDGFGWGKIGAKAAHGTTNEPNSYQFLDEKPITGTNFYRLVTVDLDGQFEKSAVVAVDFSGKEGWSIYPNPAGDELTVVFSEKNEGFFEVFDWTGRLVKSQAFFEKSNKIDLSGMPSGAYWLRLNGFEGKVFLKK